MRTGLTAAAVVIGALCGIALFTFGYARGGSYLTDDPAACANCHIMEEQRSGWVKSSHRNVAVCNDCHAPAALIPKYWTKAVNGFFHSYAFTTGYFEDNIQITPRNRSITERSCLKCHSEIAHGIQGSCIGCHRQVGHQ
ncbi:MAG TPA: cytochrome c nitrite reductase small subunit [Bryobacteraceae bacterium]|nr:cytochrome c nitrite reductase small subunit [Bryobacteraceae bacterium]